MADGTLSFAAPRIDTTTRRFQLVVEPGQGPVRKIALEPGIYNVGAAPESDVRITDPHV
jgi:hypothetical protein